MKPVPFTFVPDVNRWAVVPTNQYGLGPRDKAKWLLTVERILESRERDMSNAREALAAILGLPSPPEGVTRMLYIPVIDCALVLADLVVCEAEKGWRETLVETMSHPVGLLREPEIHDISVGEYKHGIVATRVFERDGAVHGASLLAAQSGDATFMLRWESRDLLAVAAVRDDARDLLAGIEVAASNTSS